MNIELINNLINKVDIKSIIAGKMLNFDNRRIFKWSFALFLYGHFFRSIANIMNRSKLIQLQ